MKNIILTAAIAICATFGVHAQNIYGTSSKRNSTSSLSIGTTNSSVRYQQGYTRKDGTYVQGHYKTSTNTTNHDNFSTLLRVLLEPMPVITLPMHTIMDQVALFIPVVVVDNII